MSGSGSCAAAALPRSAKVNVRTRVRTCVWLFYHTGEQEGLREASRRLRRRRAVERLLHLLGHLEDPLDEAGVEGVSAAGCDDLADDGASAEGKGADEIEHLVAHELVAVAKRAVHDAAVVEDDRVFDRAAARQAGGAHLLDVFHEAERARRGDLLEEAVVVEVEVNGLASDHRMIEVDFVFDAEAIGGIDAGALGAVDDLDRLPGAEGPARGCQGPGARG